MAYLVEAVAFSVLLSNIVRSRVEWSYSRTRPESEVLVFERYDATAVGADISFEGAVVDSDDVFIASEDDLNNALIALWSDGSEVVPWRWFSVLSVAFESAESDDVSILAPGRIDAVTRLELDG